LAVKIGDNVWINQVVYSGELHHEGILSGNNSNNGPRTSNLDSIDSVLEYVSQRPSEAAMPENCELSLRSPGGVV
jgi:hypothetical protein